MGDGTSSKRSRVRIIHNRRCPDTWSMRMTMTVHCGPYQVSRLKVALLRHWQYWHRKTREHIRRNLRISSSVSLSIQRDTSSSQFCKVHLKWKSVIFDRWSAQVETQQVGVIFIQNACILCLCERIAKPSQITLPVYWGHNQSSTNRRIQRTLSTSASRTLWMTHQSRSLACSMICHRASFCVLENLLQSAGTMTCLDNEHLRSWRSLCPLFQSYF
jgi:hypothetical protein